MVSVSIHRSIADYAHLCAYPTTLLLLLYLGILLQTKLNVVIDILYFLSQYIWYICRLRLQFPHFLLTATRYITLQYVSSTTYFLCQLDLVRLSLYDRITEVSGLHKILGETSRALTSGILNWKLNYTEMFTGTPRKCCRRYLPSARSFSVYYRPMAWVCLPGTLLQIYG